MPSESDIVERLCNEPVDRALCYQAAATIEALRAENERLRGAANWTLQLLEDAPDINPSNYDHDQACALNAVCNEAWTYLDAALQGGQSNE